MSIYNEPFKRHLKELVDYWKSKLMLDHYDVSIEYKEPGKKTDDYNATIEIEMTYLRAIIVIYPPLAEYWKNRDYDYIRRVIVHELCHIICKPYESIAEKYTPKIFHEALAERNEQLACTIANIVINNDKKENK